MADLRTFEGGFEARCELCGRWREVELRQLPCDAFFEHHEALFTCCGLEQSARLTVEKDELDFH